MDMLSREGDTLLVRLPLEIDHHSTREMAIQIDRAVMESNVSAIVFDFGGTKFMDSSGIGLLAGRVRKMQSLGGSVALKGVSPQLTKILQLSGIEKIIGRI